MTARGILKNWAGWIDGRGYAGNAESYTPPALALTTEDFRAGGMDAPLAIEMGMDRLEATMTLTEMSAEAAGLFGLTEGAVVPMTLRGSSEDADGTVHAEHHTLRGQITRLAWGGWQAAQRPTLELTISLTYFRYRRDDRDIIEIDVPNMKRIVNGVDQLAARRTAMGL
jgi:P2 family phage contractile tail tube protein